MIGGRAARAVAIAAAPLLLGLVPTAARAQSPAGAYSGTCPENGAPADEAYCKFFVQYSTKPGTLSSTVREFLQIEHASDTRTIGLIIAIDDYPNMPGHNLSAAAVDATNLQNFLLNDEHFDEVIVLRNADATVENINYFLENYLPNHADDYRGADGQGKARLLIAYSGHGRPQTPSADAAFILSSATKVDGSSGIYKMTNFTSDVSSLAAHYFQVLTLINACFGANIFTPGDRGVAGVPNGPGSFAITAGAPKNEVQALIPQRGSLFFDLIVNGIRNADADTQSAGFYVSDGTSVASETLTLSLPLYNYLSGAFYKINNVQTKANPHFLTISPPYFGPVQAGEAQGGFFFVTSKPPVAVAANVVSMKPYLDPIAPGSPIEVASISEHVGAASAPLHQQSASIVIPVGEGGGPLPLTPRPPAPPPAPPVKPLVSDASDIPLGPISSIQGRPDLKIFKPPVIYPIKGYDFSSADGRIDWAAFKQTALPRFLYVRALGWAGPDTMFHDRWSNAVALASRNVDRGAYLKFNFCLTAQQQIQKLHGLVPPDAALLPVGIELVTPTPDQPRGAAQLVCYNHLGLAAARDEILKLATGVAQQWGKTPILLGNSYNLSVLTDARADAFMLQLNAYSAQGATKDQFKLGGNNPWTLWQYSGSLTVAGVGPRTTGEVFFGTAVQYEDFRRGRGNVALAAVQ